MAKKEIKKEELNVEELTDKDVDEAVGGFVLDVQKGLDQTCTKGSKPYVRRITKSVPKESVKSVKSLENPMTKAKKGLVNPDERN